MIQKTLTTMEILPQVISFLQSIGKTSFPEDERGLRIGEKNCRKLLEMFSLKMDTTSQLQIESAHSFIAIANYIRLRLWKKQATTNEEKNRLKTELKVMKLIGEFVGLRFIVCHPEKILNELSPEVFRPELIQLLEKRLDIVLDDQETKTFITVGDVIDLVISKKLTPMILHKAS